jgi:hypothetical protein
MALLVPPLKSFFGAVYLVRPNSSSPAWETQLTFAAQFNVRGSNKIL